MKKDKTEVVIILDRSGSMSYIRDAMEEGLNSFVEGQKSGVGECYLTLAQFDDKYEMVFDNVEISKVESVRIEPRGSTALLDAIGKTINSVGSRLSSTDESERPEKVIFVIVTDGEENCSKEFTNSMVKEMVEHQEEKYKWEFVYLGANQDAISVSQDFGISRDSTMNYAANNTGCQSIYDSLGKKILISRSVKSLIEFDDEDREKAVQ